MISVRRSLSGTFLVICVLLSISCAILRIQTIHGAKPVWLSRTGDDASLRQLALLNAGKAPATDSFLRLEKGVQVYVTEYTKKRCHGRDVFIKVQIKDGESKGVEGWICGASITHRKGGAL